MWNYKMLGRELRIFMIYIYINDWFIFFQQSFYENRNQKIAKDSSLLGIKVFLFYRFVFQERENSLLKELLKLKLSNNRKFLINKAI